MTVAGEEYDKEVGLRQDLEAEVARLKAQLHGQIARLSVISSDEKRQESLRRRSNDLAHSVTGLELDLSRLRAQRDMTLAEVEELQASRNRYVIEVSSADNSVPRLMIRRVLSANLSLPAWTLSKSSIVGNWSR